MAPKLLDKQIAGLSKALKKTLYYSNGSSNLDLYISSLTEYNPFYKTNEILEWLNYLNSKELFNVEERPLTTLRKWKFNSNTGDLEHDSGGFFSIRGLKVKTNMGLIPEWSQPIIYQPEIGILGFITKKINGILYFLVQAKAEPGNINTYQLSPTVQATRSNYLQLHGGKPTKYIEYFLGSKKSEVLIDRLQSEQGARFHRKRNRNMIVRIADNEKINVETNYKWLTLGQIKALTQIDNVVNMDARSVVSMISFCPERTSSLKSIDQKCLQECLNSSGLVTNPVSGYAIKLMVSSHSNSASLYSMEEILRKISEAKAKVSLERQLIPLKDVVSWRKTKTEIHHEDMKYFSIIGVRVECKDREVRSWDQPIVKQHQIGIVGFISKEIDGVLHFLVQLKMESGADLLEVAPTVQCITDNYTDDDMPVFTDKFLKRDGFDTITDTYQSEEGGRFYKESNHNIILLTNSSFSAGISPFFLWITMSQLKELIRFNNLVNVEARSLLACLPSV